MISLKFGKIAFAAAVMPALLTQTAVSAASAKSARAPQAAERVVVKCKKSEDQVKRGKGCAPVAWAESAVAKTNGFVPLTIGAVVATAAGALVLASNSKNCGKGNNSGTGSGNGGQNNGNCPASP